MAVAHVAASGAGALAGKVVAADWASDHLHVPFDVGMVFLSAATGPAAASAAANTECFSVAKVTRTRIDLAQATQVRMTGMVIVNGNATGAAIKLSYMLTEAATWAGTDAGASIVLGTGTAGTLRDSGWQTLTAGARVNNVTLAALVGVAFGTTPPTISSLSVMFR